MVCIQVAMDTGMKPSELNMAVIIPSYNEERYIADVLRDIKSVPHLFTILIDDGSVDRTVEKAQGLAEQGT